MSSQPHMLRSEHYELINSKVKLGRWVVEVSGQTPIEFLIVNIEIISEQSSIRIDCKTLGFSSQKTFSARIKCTSLLWSFNHDLQIVLRTSWSISYDKDITNLVILHGAVHGVRCWR